MQQGKKKHACLAYVFQSGLPVNASCILEAPQIVQTAVSNQDQHDQCCMANLIPNSSFLCCQLPVLAMTDGVVFTQNISVPHAKQDPDLTACQQTAHEITSKESGAHLLTEQQPAYLFGFTGTSFLACKAMIQHQSGMGSDFLQLSVQL